MSIYLNLLIILLYVENSQGIIGGEQTSLLHWPSYAVIKFRSNHFCGASMFHPHWILTGAQCIDPQYVDPKKIEGIALGVSCLDKPSGILVPSELIFSVGYPSYTVDLSGLPMHDIAVIRIPKSVTLTTTIHDVPISKSTDQTVAARKCYTAGFGISNIDIFEHEIGIQDAFHKTRNLYEVEQVIVPLNECISVLENQLNYKTDLDDLNHLCARGAKEKEGPSFGDIGSPLICGGYQIAVCSLSCYAPEISSYLYTIYTKIDNYRPWIESEVTNNPESESSNGQKEPQKQPEDYNEINIRNMYFEDTSKWQYDSDKIQSEQNPNHNQILNSASNGKTLKDIYQEKIDYLSNCVSKLVQNRDFIFYIIICVLFTKYAIC